MLKNRNKKLKNRVLESRKELKKLNVFKPIDKFARKFPSYVNGIDKKEKEKSINRLRNLFYCKVFDEDFTAHLESFVEFKKVNK